RRAVDLIGTDDGLPFESIRSVCQDSTGAIWATTQNGLLARQDGTNWTVLSQATNWPGGTANCVASDSAGNVWIGTGEHGLVKFANGEYESYRTRSGLANDSVHGLLVASSGDVWLAFSSHLQRLHNGEFENISLPPGTRYLRALAEDTAGNI